MKALLQLMLTVVLTATSIPCWATNSATSSAESQAMQRERALNRILVGERQQREREAATRGSGLMGIKPAAAKAAPPKAASGSSDQTKKSKKSQKAAKQQ